MLFPNLKRNYLRALAPNRHSMPQKLTKTLNYELYTSFSDLHPEDQTLVQMAQKACESSYSPYSNFRVGAALLLEDGRYVQGSNQENAAFPDGLCAERVAFFASGAFYPGVRILKIAVVAKRAGTDTFVAASPCGSCRQVMREYEEKQAYAIPLILQWENGHYIKSTSIADLLPFSFGKASLL
jgi:cytidine deaminase